ncbi:hypothetical protein IEN91_05255 [Bacillus velezensis]|uniref:hypothetical protein n=1 Tax=Bacillus velezensis TaxID=492670 RepID=UPI0018C49324|nr:hypothetical protein [Bacillus velezensis]QPK89846.1 hypothetical protein IEN91_05255 [Bacillus velezensis]
MPKEDWHKGYKEVKNVIHNDIGVTKDEILEVFRQVVKDEIDQIISGKSSFIKESIREAVRHEMAKISEQRNYPKMTNGLWLFNGNNSFSKFIAEVMKEEITKALSEQFDIKLNIDKKDKD